MLAMVANDDAGYSGSPAVLSWFIASTLAPTGIAAAAIVDRFTHPPLTLRHHPVLRQVAIQGLILRRLGIVPRHLPQPSLDPLGQQMPHRRLDRRQRTNCAGSLVV